MTREKAIARVEVGCVAIYRKQITDDDVFRFAEASGDFNPVHMDGDYACRTVFGDRIAHGILTLGIVSAALAKLPGVVVYISQSVRFLHPVKIGDTIEAAVYVTDKHLEKSEVGLRTTCRNQNGDLVLDGEARVKLFDLRPGSLPVRLAGAQTTEAAAS
jgi:3-hydroxybutyryl-CoA dehydratase